MPPTEKITAKNFHIVGGGCFGSGYAKWLLRAQSLGWLDFEKIILIDHNPTCAATKLDLPQDQVQFAALDWIEYFAAYLLQNYQTQTVSQDHWVPSPLSPHILFLGMQRALSALSLAKFSREIAWQSSAPTQELGLPVNMKLKSGDVALSFAKWKCPVHCIEPGTCPAIHQKRDWDMQLALNTDLSGGEVEKTSTHILQCTHLIHGVGTIPCQNILAAFQKLLKDITEKECREICVATVSKCHGLISQAKLKR